MKKRTLVIAGPTGSGESTITKELIGRFPGKFARLVTATTRSPRNNEKHAEDYYFFSKEDFLAKQEAGEMLETTHVPNRDVYYGTYAPDLKQKLDAGYIVIINPDVVGAKYYKKHYNATNIFILPKDVSELKGRLEKRDPDITKEELDYRLENAQREIDEECDYYDYQVVNSDGQLEKTMEQIIEILKKDQYEF